MLNFARFVLSRIFWSWAFRCAGLEPPLVVGPEDVARQESRGLDRLAKKMSERRARARTNGPDVLRVVIQDGEVVPMPEYAFTHEMMTAETRRVLGVPTAKELEKHL
jgi:hypothetical protein